MAVSGDIQNLTSPLEFTLLEQEGWTSQAPEVYSKLNYFVFCEQKNNYFVASERTVLTTGPTNKFLSKKMEYFPFANAHLE